MVRPRPAARPRDLRRWLLSRLLWVTTAVAVGSLVVIAALWAQPLSALFGTGSGTTTSTPVISAISTRPPGDALPSDDQCARVVSRAPETIRSNATYNRTVGRQKLSHSFFTAGSHDQRATTQIAARVTGAYSGSTREILQWTACKWGIDERIVWAQAQIESSWRQSMKGDWTSNGDYCAPGHGIGMDGRPGQCPGSWGILQVRYRYFPSAFPDAVRSTAFNADTAYAVWRACYEGYEWWLSSYAGPGHAYQAGDAWGCIGRWYSGRWYDDLATEYIDCVQRIVDGRPPCR